MLRNPTAEQSKHNTTSKQTTLSAYLLKGDDMNTIEAKNMAVRLMDHHGLIEKGWTFVWMKMKRTFGQCWHSKKQILLSWPLTSLNDETTVRDTILHEIAHALAGYLSVTTATSKHRDTANQNNRDKRAATVAASTAAVGSMKDSSYDWSN